MDAHLGASLALVATLAAGACSTARESAPPAGPVAPEGEEAEPVHAVGPEAPVASETGAAVDGERFHAVALRDGEMWLHPMGDGTLLVSAGVELLELEAGRPVQRQPRRLQGLVPPSEYNRWTVVALSGHWPANTVMVLDEFLGCTNPIAKAYRRSGERWESITSPTDDIALTFRHTVAFGTDGVIGETSWELNDHLRFRYDCDGQIPRALRRKLAKRRPRYTVVAADGTLGRAPKTLPRRLHAAPNGDVVGIAGNALVRVAPSGRQTKRALSTAGHPNHAQLVHVGAREVYVAEQDPPRLLVLDDDSWQPIGLPQGESVTAVSGGADAPLWLISWASGDEGDRIRLWERETDGGWTEQFLPTVAFPDDADLGGWFEDRSAVALSPAQVVVRSADEVWVLGYDAAGGPGLSAVFSTQPAAPVLRVPGYARQRLDALAHNPPTSTESPEPL